MTASLRHGGAPVRTSRPSHGAWSSARTRLKAAFRFNPLMRRSGAVGVSQRNCCHAIGHMARQVVDQRSTGLAGAIKRKCLEHEQAAVCLFSAAQLDRATHMHARSSCNSLRMQSGPKAISGSIMMARLFQSRPPERKQDVVQAKLERLCVNAAQRLLLQFLKNAERPEGNKRCNRGTATNLGYCHQVDCHPTCIQAAS